MHYSKILTNEKDISHQEIKTNLSLSHSMKLRVVLARRRRLKSSPGSNKIEYKFAQFIKYLYSIHSQTMGSPEDTFPIYSSNTRSIHLIPQQLVGLYSIDCEISLKL